MFLLDANCWMQIARKRDHEEEVRSLLTVVPTESIFISDFALHSLAILFGRFRTLSTFPVFLDETGIGQNIRIVRNGPAHWQSIVAASQQWRLDVEDAYQYVAAEANHLRIVSLDADFDRTPLGRLTPAGALALFQQGQPPPGR